MIIIPLDDGENERQIAAHLRAVVWEYIRSGRPIGSRALAKTTGLNLSPATLRNAMADLEEAGLLQSPHTSAGRLPSTDGIRFFVDSILTMRPPDESTRALLRENMRGETSSDLLRAALDSLLAVTRFAGFVAIPAREPPRLAKIQFVKLGARRVMPVLLTVDGEIVNRVIELAQDADADDLNVAADFLNRAFTGARSKRRKTRSRGKWRICDRKSARYCPEMIEVLATDTAPEMRVSGERNLVGSAEMPADIDRLRRLFTTLEKKRDLLRLIEETGRADDLQLFIGSGVRQRGAGGLQRRVFGVQRRGRQKNRRHRRHRPQANEIRAGDAACRCHGQIGRRGGVAPAADFSPA